MSFCDVPYDILMSFPATTASPWPTTFSARGKSIRNKLSNTRTQLGQQISGKVVRNIRCIYMFVLALIHRASAEDKVIAYSIARVMIQRRFREIINCNVCMIQHCCEVHRLMFRDVRFHGRLYLWMNISGTDGDGRAWGARRPRR